MRLTRANLSKGTVALAAYVALGFGAGPITAQAYGVNLDGRPLTTLSSPGTSVIVLLFLATDCPLSNRYQPEIASLAREYAAQPVKMWIVYPNPAENAVGVRAHQQEFGQSVPALLDPRQALVRLAGARMTPEAAVFRATPEGLREVYRGRIDDRYLSLGLQRPRATHRDLADAIHAVLADLPVHPAGRGASVGCAIVPLP